MWKHRLMLESLCHSDSAFVTLTYADDTLPAGNTLVPADLQLWLKKIRWHWPSRLRFYAVGEYGRNGYRGWNPHYHVMLFGYPTCLKGRSVYDDRRPDCCSQCDLVRDTWKKGRVGLGTVTVQSAGYVVDYITKNMRRTDDARLEGRWPEFARMSLRPGIGFNALDDISQTYMVFDLDKRGGDVAAGNRVGASIKPMGRYLRGKLRDMLGMENEGFTDKELSSVWEGLKDVPAGTFKRLAFKNALIDLSAQRIGSMEVRAKIMLSKQGKTL